MRAYQPIEQKAASLVDRLAGKLEDIAEWLHELSDRIAGEQCPHFLLFGGDKYVGRELCQKRKGHRGVHRTAEGKAFNNE